MGDITGKIFQITSWGESHGPAIGAVLTGCPPGLEIDILKDIKPDMERRKPGQSKITTQRSEEDIVKIESGIYEGITTGTPISIRVENKDSRPKDYKSFQNVPRPSHADLTYEVKYGVRDPSGGGRSSNRIFGAYVAAGAIAKKFLKERHGIEIVSYVQQVKDIQGEIDIERVCQEDVEKNIIRCPDEKAAVKMIRLIEQVKASGDSVGGIVGCVIRNMPIGLGEPIADKLQADLAKVMFTIGAVKGFEYGSGFEGTLKKGSENNDEFYISEKKEILTKTNNSGGIQGGISNGMPIYFKVGFKPTATILRPQQSVNLDKMELETFRAKGRHDPCVLPRAVPNIEAMTAIVLADHSIIRYGNRRVKI